MADRATWHRRAACLGHSDPDMWVDIGKGRRAIEALRICGGCPVRSDCLDYALSEVRVYDDTGIFGGTTDRSRREVRLGRMTRAEAMAHGDAIAEERTQVEAIAEEEPWLLSEVAHG